MNTNEIVETSNVFYPYNPIYLDEKDYLTYLETGTGCKSVYEVNNIPESFLMVYDAYHFYFDDTGIDEGISSPGTLEASLAVDLARIINSQKPVANHTTAAPLWSRLRDNAITFNFPQMLSENMGSFINHLIHNLSGNSIVLDASPRDLESEYNTTTLNVPKNHLNYLLDFQNRTRSIIEDNLIENCTTKEALNFVSAYPNSWITINDKSQPKWYWESYWLTKQLLKELPAFRCNYNTLIIKCAYRYLMDGTINANRLYHLFAALGKSNLRIIFVG